MRGAAGLSNRSTANLSSARVLTRQLDLPSRIRLTKRSKSIIQNQFHTDSISEEVKSYFNAVNKETTTQNTLWKPRQHNNKYSVSHTDFNKWIRLNRGPNLQFQPLITQTHQLKDKVSKRRKNRRKLVRKYFEEYQKKNTIEEKKQDEDDIDIVTNSNQIASTQAILPDIVDDNLESDSSITSLHHVFNPNQTIFEQLKSLNQYLANSKNIRLNDPSYNLENIDMTKLEPDYKPLFNNSNKNLKQQAINEATKLYVKNGLNSENNKIIIENVVNPDRFDFGFLLFEKLENCKDSNNEDFLVNQLTFDDIKRFRIQYFNSGKISKMSGTNYNDHTSPYYRPSITNYNETLYHGSEFKLKCEVRNNNFNFGRIIIVLNEDCKFINNNPDWYEVVRQQWCNIETATHFGPESFVRCTTDKPTITLKFHDIPGKWNKKKGLIPKMYKLLSRLKIERHHVNTIYRDQNDPSVVYIQIHDVDIATLPKYVDTQQFHYYFDIITDEVIKDPIQRLNQCTYCGHYDCDPKKCIKNAELEIAREGYLLYNPLATPEDLRQIEKRLTGYCHKCGQRNAHRKNECPNNEYCLNCHCHGHRSRASINCPIAVRKVLLALWAEQKGLLSSNVKQLLLSRKSAREAFLSKNQYNTLTNSNIIHSNKLSIAPQLNSSFRNDLYKKDDSEIDETKAETLPNINNNIDVPMDCKLKENEENDLTDDSNENDIPSISQKDQTDPNMYKDKNQNMCKDNLNPSISQSQLSTTSSNPSANILLEANNLMDITTMASAINNTINSYGPIRSSNSKITSADTSYHPYDSPQQYRTNPNNQNNLNTLLPPNQITKGRSIDQLNYDDDMEMNNETNISNNDNGNNNQTQNIDDTNNHSNINTNNNKNNQNTNQPGLLQKFFNSIASPNPFQTDSAPSIINQTNNNANNFDAIKAQKESKLRAQSKKLADINRQQQGILPSRPSAAQIKKARTQLKSLYFQRNVSNHYIQWCKNQKQKVKINQEEWLQRFKMDRTGHPITQSSTIRTTKLMIEYQLQTGQPLFSDQLLLEDFQRWKMANNKNYNEDGSPIVSIRNMLRYKIPEFDQFLKNLKNKNQELPR